jgi:hypothetical protein
MELNSIFKSGPEILEFEKIALQLKPQVLKFKEPGSILDSKNQQKKKINVKMRTRSSLKNEELNDAGFPHLGYCSLIWLLREKLNMYAEMLGGFGSLKNYELFGFHKKWNPESDFGLDLEKKTN